MKIVTSLIERKAKILTPIKRYNHKLCVHTKSTNYIINKTDISYLQSDSNYCRIYLHDGTSILCSKTLKDINHRIHNPKFFKVHSSYVVNTDDIATIDASYTELTLADGARIPISRARKPELKEVVRNIFD